MKRLLLAITILSSLLGSNPKQELKTNPEIYPTTLKVITITDMQMICETASGIVYTIKDQADDMEVGDLVAVIMDENGTPNTILDDYVVAWRYSGYWIDETENEEGGA